MRTRLTTGAVVLALLASHASADTRVAPPAPAEETRLRQSVHQQYADLYNSDDRADQLSLSRDLWKASTDAETTNQEYALMCESRDAAAKAGDITTADNICKAIAKKFDVNLNTTRAGMLKAGANNITAPDTYFALLFTTTDQALIADDFDSARQLLETGASALAAGRSDKWQFAFDHRQSQYNAQLKVYPLVKPALDALRKDPTDPQSNTVAGNYTCLVKNDWSNGLKMLAQGDDQPLKKLATAELQKPDDTDQQIAIADGWLAQAGRLPQFAQALQVHAYDDNIHALPYATMPLQRTHIETQLNSLIPTLGTQRTNAALWFAVGDTLSRRVQQPSDIAGGMKAVDNFQDLPAYGGVLVGFNYALAMLNNQPVITYLQPIYLTPTGEQTGAEFGKAYSKIRNQHAPDGYAVGALKVFGGDGLNSIVPYYMRIDGNQLDSRDQQTGARIGGLGGTSQILDGGDKPVIGICGRHTDGFLGIGLVYSQPVKEDNDSTQPQ